MNKSNQFKVNIYRDMNEEKHIHTDVELLYVVEGSIRIKLKDSVFTLERDDVFVINSSILHSIESVEKNIVCSIMYDYQVLVEVLKKPNSFFLCNSATDKNKSYSEIIGLCRDIVYQHVTSIKKTNSLMYSMLYRLLDELIENHMVDDTNAEVSENYDVDEKLQLIIHYVHTNYQDGISLSNLAKEMYTSASTLSRLFKKQTGTYFAEYVNQVRTRYAIDELLYTQKNMTKIAMDCGFSNASAFTKVFREIYNMAPTEYRQKMQGNAPQVEEFDDDIKQKIQTEFRREKTDTNTDLLVEDTVDVKESSELKHCWNKLVNVGFVHDVLRANTQYHIQYLAREIGFVYARIWMIFNTKNMVTDGETVGDYNFDMIFEALDFLVENRIIPWLDFTNRPYANVTNTTESEWFEDIRVKYKDKRVWESMYKQFFKQLVRRYGEKNVAKWRFEIGIEGFHADYDEMFDVDYISAYDYVSRTIKELVPDANVGFSAGAAGDDMQAFDEILKRLSGLKHSPDFISVILFPYISRTLYTEKGKKAEFVRSKDMDFEGTSIGHLYECFDKNGVSHDKLVIAEWNLTCSNQNYLNDSSFRGCVLIRNVVKFSSELDILGLWIASDWQCNSFASRSVINGGGGIVSKDCIRKPVFFALKMLNNLGSNVIARGDNYIVTKVADDEYQILCFNPVWYNSSYFIDAENQSTVEKAKTYFDMKADRHLKIKLSGVSENSGYYVKKRSVNKDHGSIIDEWAKFDNDSKLERMDIKYLQEMCVPDLSRTRCRSKGNVLSLEVDMQAEEFCILHVFPEY